MIAPIRLAKRTRNSESSRDRFLVMLPKIRAQALVAFRNVRAERRKELIQEVIANAFCAFTRLVRQGKEHVAYPTPLTWYAIRQIRDGRRVGSKRNVRDISSAVAQQRFGIRVERLDRYDLKKNDWREVLVEDRHATPADLAAARIDVADWFRAMKPRARKIAKALAAGETTFNVAKQFDVSPARISQLRRELQESWEEFQRLPAAA